MTTTQDSEWLEEQLEELLFGEHDDEHEAVAEAVAETKSHILSEALELIEQQDPSSGRKTGETYWGNTLRKAFITKYSREGKDDL